HHELDGADHLDVRAVALELQRHLEEARRARVARVEAMAESRDGLVLRLAALDDLGGGVAVRGALADELESLIEELHAALDVAAVMPPEAEHARGDARPQRR